MAFQAYLHLRKNWSDSQCFLSHRIVTKVQLKKGDGNIPKHPLYADFEMKRSQTCILLFSVPDSSKTFNEN